MSERSLLDRYNCGHIRFSGTDNGLYERHLIFDRVVTRETATPRDKFEAVAHSVRDVLSQRWLKTERTYLEANVKRVYYVSLEFLIGRALANNISSLLLEPVSRNLYKRLNIDPLEIIEEEPDAGLGNGGLGRLAACFLDSMATLGIPGMGSGLRYEYGIFKQSVQGGWQHEHPDHWLARPDPWEIARPSEAVEVRLACSFDMHGGALRPVHGRPSTLIGLAFYGSAAFLYIFALRKILNTIESNTPYLFVENLTVRTQVPAGFKPQPGAEPDMFVQFDISGYALTGAS